MVVEYEKVELEEYFVVPKKILFQDLLDSRTWARLSLGAKCELEPKVGGIITLYDNNVTGRFIKINEYDLLEFEWRFNDFPDGVVSVVSIKFYEEEEDVTRLVISHNKIPKYDKFGNDGVKTRCLVGWNNNFIGRFQHMLGYNKYTP